MKLLALFITDGRRECIARTVPSFFEALDLELDRAIVVDDSGDPDYRSFLRSTFPELELRAHDSRRGHAETMRDAFEIVAEVDPDLVVHVEDDFLFVKPLELEAMAKILELRPHLCQIALRRQAWYPSELRAGGIVEKAPEFYRDCSEGALRWLEHRLFFTTNPTLYRRDLVDLGWPAGARSERAFARRVFADPLTRSAFFGAREEPPRVIHIGEERAGYGY